MLFIVLGACAPSPDTELSEPPLAEYAVATVWTPENAEALAFRMADKYALGSIGIRETFVETMRHESSGFTDPCIQSTYPGDGPNGQENSFGYAQFWLTQPMTTPEGTPITKDIACDPVRALDAAAWHFSQGRAGKWSSYHLLVDGK